MTVSSRQDRAGPPSGWLRRATSIEVAAVAGLVIGVGWIVSPRGLLASPGLGATREEIQRAGLTADGSPGSIYWIAKRDVLLGPELRLDSHSRPRIDSRDTGTVRGGRPRVPG